MGESCAAEEAFQPGHRADMSAPLCFDREGFGRVCRVGLEGNQNLPRNSAAGTGGCSHPFPWVTGRAPLPGTPLPNLTCSNIATDNRVCTDRLTDCVDSCQMAKLSHLKS